MAEYLMLRQMKFIEQLAIDQTHFEGEILKEKQRDRENPILFFKKQVYFPEDRERYRSEGINVDTPTIEDIKKMQMSIAYTLPDVSDILRKNRRMHFTDLTPQEQSDAEVLFFKLYNLWKEEELREMSAEDEIENRMVGRITKFISELKEKLNKT